MKFNILKNSKGITLMELVIVLAIIAIIGAIIAPNFLNATDRARIRSDIQSAIVIQNAINLYQIETGNTFNTTNVDEILNTLVSQGYLAGQANLNPQTYGAFWVINNNLLKIDVSAVSPQIINSLNENERSMLLNIPI